MPDHQIRLRGAWDWQGTVDEKPDLRRVDLPWDLPAEPPGPFRLVRQFGRPPVDPARESVFIRLERVAGLVGVTLNGRDLPDSELLRDPAGVSCPVDSTLLPRNSLVLHVDPTGLDPLDAQGWGVIAIVIRSRPDAGAST